MSPREYRVAASCFHADTAQPLEQRRGALREHLSALLQEQRPDLVVLPEVAVVPDFHAREDLGAEPLEGPTAALAAELAAQHAVNLCVPIVEERDGLVFNTAVYVDRRGARAGVFRKQVLTNLELDRGLRPGPQVQLPVELDGLRVGTAICFDQNFTDLIWPWIEAGVDLLTFPAYTYAGNLMRHWAIACGVPLVAAFPWESTIFDRDGTILVEAGTMTDTVRGGYHAPWIAWTLNMQSRVYHLDGNQNLLPQVAAHYGGRVDIRLMVRDGRMMISAVDDDVDLEELERRIGLVPLQKYLRNGRLKNEAARPA